jgi:hypothetical protein
MYADELFDQGLTGCTFVLGGKVVSYFCCILIAFSLWSPHRHSLCLAVSMDTHEIIWLILIYCIKYPFSKGQGIELAFAVYLTLWAYSVMRLPVQQAAA